MSEYCQGCFSFVHSDIDHFCAHEKYNTNGECPCTKCVVKVMCNEPCSDFLNFKHETIENLKDEYTTRVIQEIMDG